MSNEKKNKPSSLSAKQKNALPEKWYGYVRQIAKLTQVKKQERRLAEKRKKREQMKERSREDKSNHYLAERDLQGIIYPHIISKIKIFSKNISSIAKPGKRMSKEGEKYSRLLIESDLIYKLIRPALFAGYKARSPYYITETSNGFTMENDDKGLPSFEIKFSEFDENLNFKNGKKDKSNLQTLADLYETWSLEDKYQQELYDKLAAESENAHVDLTQLGLTAMAKQDYEAADHEVNVVVEENPDSIDVAQEAYLDSGKYDPNKESNLIQDTKYQNDKKKLQTSVGRMKLISKSTPELKDIKTQLDDLLYSLDQGLQGSEGKDKNEVWKKAISDNPEAHKALKEFVGKQMKEIEQGKPKSIALMQFLTYIKYIN